MKHLEEKTNENIDSVQAHKELKLDVPAYHQSVRASEPESKICIAFGNLKNISWKKSDELEETLRRLSEENNRDCYVSISEYCGEIRSKKYIKSIKIFYVRLLKNEKFNPSTPSEGVNLILEHCRKNDIPKPTIIVYDGNEYCVKWVIREPLEAKYLRLWQHLQERLAHKFFYVLNSYGLMEAEMKRRYENYVEAHKDATVMLRVPGFLNNETMGVDLFHPKQEVRVVFSSERRFSVGEFARELHLNKSEVLRYREIKADCGGYRRKISKRSTHEEENSSTAPQPTQEDLVRIICADLQKIYAAGQEKTHIYFQWKNLDKHERTDRAMYYGSCLTENFEVLATRLARAECDYWTSAAEYKIPLRPRYKTCKREINGEKREEKSLKVPKNEKWVEIIRLNFLLLDFRKSELEYMPTPEQGKELVYARCRELGLSKPEIIDTCEEYTCLELRWYWQDKICNEERESWQTRYPGFSSKFKSMQEKLFRLFWDLGANEKKLSPSIMLNISGTLNTRSGNRRKILAEASEKLTSAEMLKRLDEALTTCEPEKLKKTEREAPIERTASEISETMERFIQLSKGSPSLDMLKIVNGLAKYFDVELLIQKKDNESSKPLSEQDKGKLSIQMRQKNSIYYEGESSNLGGEDFRRLHSVEYEGKNKRWLCVCTENKGKWSEYWVEVDSGYDRLLFLRDECSGFEGVNVYVSQLEFKSRKRTVSNVTAFSVCFVDVDGKIRGRENFGAEEWKCLVLDFCQRKGIPVPSEIVFSGNGVHVKYFFNRSVLVAPNGGLREWERLERMLYELFKEIGADSKATDGARVLRLVGTQNCKPETKDRDVRIVFSGGDYDFEDFAISIKLLCERLMIVGDKTSVAEPVACKTKCVRRGNVECVPSGEGTSSENQFSALKKISNSPHFVPQGACLFVNDITLNHSEFISVSEASRYFEALNHNHEFECSIVSYRDGKRQDRRECIENIYFSYVVLEGCLECDFASRLAEIRRLCQSYRGVGIPEPNRILRDGNRLILLWRFAREDKEHVLPGCALSRWKTVQEFLARYFEVLGAVSHEFTVKSTTLLPLTGFRGMSGEVVERVYDAPNERYLFDTLARAVLPFSQPEVKAHEEQKRANPSKRILALEELTQEYLSRRSELGQRSKFKTALKIFNEIVKLITARQNSEGEVSQGYRELCVFYAMNFAVQAGLIKEKDDQDFNELVLKLIKLCGSQFALECSEKQLKTLREKFVKGEPVYRPKIQTLINDLGITSEEQTKLEILKVKNKPEKKKKRKTIWEILGVSKATYYRREKQRREVAAKLLRLQLFTHLILSLIKQKKGIRIILPCGLYVRRSRILAIAIHCARSNSLEKIRPPPLRKAGKNHMRF